MLFALAFFRIQIDTDPENMLEADQPDRVFYNQVKERFHIRDFVAVGIFDEGDLMRTESLQRLKEIMRALLAIDGVVAADVASFESTNNMVVIGPGEVSMRPTWTRCRSLPKRPRSGWQISRLPGRSSVA